MKFLSLSCLTLLLLSFAGSDLQAQNRDRDRRWGPVDEIQNQLDRIERKLDRLIRQDHRPGDRRDTVRSVVDLECMDDLVDWSTTLAGKIEFARSICRNVSSEVLEHCRLAATENNRDCFSSLDSWSYDSEEKTRLIEACRTEIYECR